MELQGASRPSLPMNEEEHQMAGGKPSEGTVSRRRKLENTRGMGTRASLAGVPADEAFFKFSFYSNSNASPETSCRRCCSEEWFFCRWKELKNCQLRLVDRRQM